MAGTAGSVAVGAGLHKMHKLYTVCRPFQRSATQINYLAFKSAAVNAVFYPRPGREEGR